MQKQNPLLRVWELGKSQHSGLICAVISAFLGVLGGMLPYFAAAQMIVNLLEGNRDMSLYFKWLCIGMAGYLVRTLLYMAKNTSKNCVIKRFFASKLKLQIITETEPIVIIKIRVLVIIYENE